MTMKTWEAENDNEWQALDMYDMCDINNTPDVSQSLHFWN